jgi:hypothetical protein
VIEPAQTVEAELADPGGAELSAVLSQLSFDPLDQEAELPRVHVPLVARAVEAGEELVAIERLVRAVALDHPGDLRDRPLVGGEAMAAGAALTAPAYGAVRYAAGLQGSGGRVAAGAVHSSESTGA